MRRIGRIVNGDGVVVGESCLTYQMPESNFCFLIAETGGIKGYWCQSSLLVLEAGCKKLASKSGILEMDSSHHDLACSANMMLWALYKDCQ